MEGFCPLTAAWFRKKFGQPTPAQAEAWPLIRAHFTTPDGILDAAEASRQILAFPPYMEFLARQMSKK